jgi:hypothetical protein
VRHPDSFGAVFFFGSLCSLGDSAAGARTHGRPPVSDSRVEFARPGQVSIPSSSRRACRWVVVAVSSPLEHAGVRFLSAGLRIWAITCRRFFSSAPLSPPIFCQRGCYLVLQVSLNQFDFAARIRGHRSCTKF